jgi:hypothetical protein
MWVTLGELENNILMITNNRGSKRLIGAASLRYRMPVITGFFPHPTGYSSLVEQQPLKLCVAGSNPAVQPSGKR